MSSEYAIHRIIKNYPYLLGKEFEKLKLKHEKIYQDGTRSDFVFADENLSVVVEVKNGKMDSEMLSQALHYLENEREENPKKLLKGMLVGRRISQTLKNEVDRTKYEFEMKLLNVDIPVQIKICDKCRKANALSNIFCKFCGSRKFIIDPFLFSCARTC